MTEFIKNHDTYFQLVFLFLKIEIDAPYIITIVMIMKYNKYHVYLIILFFLENLLYR